MNKFDCTERIDLTHDNFDLFESLLGTKSNIAKFPKPLKTMPTEDSALSVLETLKSIQRENPQVETIFLDSDDDDDDINQKHQNVKTFPPSNNVFSHENNGPECDALKLPVSPLSNSTQKTNFRVTEVSPSNLMLQNANFTNAIALNTTTKNSSATRYLVIPQEVLPILLASKGPVSLDIPGVGPLVIQKPSEILHAPRATLQITVNPENTNPITVNPENTNPIISPEKKTQKCSEEAEYDPLCDAKYQCWRYRRRIKRDLDGFSLLDRLGFYKAEQRRSKLCAFKCEENVKNLQYQIQMVKRKLNAIKDSRLKSETGKKTKKKSSKHLMKSGSKITAQIKSEVLNPVQKKNLDALISWQEHFQSPAEVSSLESDNDLLITKKVVFLKDSKTPRGRKRKIKHTSINTEDKSSSINRNIATQNRKTVNTALSSQKSGKLTDRLEQKHIKRKRGRPRKHQSLIEESKFHKVKRDITPISPEPRIKQKRGRPKKLRVKEASLLYNNEISQLRPCHVELSPLEIKPEVLERYERYKHKSEDMSVEFSHKVIIDNLKWFQNEIDLDKPILVVNEVQCFSMNLEDLCDSNNIIFPVSQSSDVSTNVLTFISSHNVKFVKPEILCQYLSGKRA